MSIHNFDVVVIGAGPAGEVLAGHLSEGGLKVAIIESHLVAGECSFYACMPSKALLRPGELFNEAGRVPGVKEALDGELDAAAVLARRDEVIHDLDDSAQLPWLEDRGIELFRGNGVIAGEREVRVGGDVLVAGKAVAVATGTGAAMPPIEGLDGVKAWNNREATTAKTVPASMIVLGAGPVGAELSQAWASLGTNVTLVEFESRVLPREEPFAAGLLAESLTHRHGVELMLGSKVVRVDRDGDVVTAHLEDGGTVQAAELLVATGRRPHTDGIDLETVGLESGGFLETDDAMRVAGLEWLYAVGDVNGRSLLTHMGKYQAWVAADQILGGSTLAGSEAIGSPRVVFTEPQVAAVGRTESEARDAGTDIRVVEVDTNANAGSSFTGKGVEGRCRIIVDDKTELIVGATFVGFQVAEWIHAATIAIVGEVPMSTLRHAVPAFPSRSEIWLKLAEAWESEK